MTSSTVDAGMVQPGPDRPRLAVRRRPGSRRAFLLVHGLASNARLWDGVAAVLGEAGHPSLAVDLRGHGLSEAPEGGYDTDTCADDLAALLAVEGLVGERAPVAVGQSWGGNVVLSLAARHPGSVAAVACVDGGWLRLGDRFASFEECWAVLAPPRLDGLRHADVATQLRVTRAGWPPEGVEGTLASLVELPDGGVRARLGRDQHRSILQSIYQGDPADWYPKVTVPVLLVPATGPEGRPAAGSGAALPQRDDATRRAVRAALAALPHGDVRWYPGADHDLHAQRPCDLAADLLALAEEVSR